MTNSVLYDNGWTYEELNLFLSMKELYYHTLDTDFKSRCPLTSYLGVSPEEYADWKFYSMLHTRISRIWTKPTYDWKKGL